jgi:hypothetical protein
LAFVERTLDGKLDDVEVEAICLRCSPEGIARIVLVSASEVPMRRRIDVTADSRGRQRRPDLIHFFFGLTSQRDTDHTCGGQTQGPLVQFHSVPPAVVFFVLYIN